MGTDNRLTEAEKVVEDMLDTACGYVQRTLGQDDGGLAALYFSGQYAADLLEDVSGDVGEWHAPGETPLLIPEGTVIEAVPALALGNLAVNLGQPVPRDWAREFTETFEAYVEAERRMQAERDEAPAPGP